jgi:hypothetical protein
VFKTVVYDDAKPLQPVETFSSENELEVVKKATGAVRFLRQSGKQPLGRYTMKLTKEG